MGMGVYKLFLFSDVKQLKKLRPKKNEVTSRDIARP